MKQHWLNEDRLPSKLLVVFSYDISNKIKSIGAYNQNNLTAIYQWRDYLNGLKSYISNPTIAWDNMNRYPRLRNGGRFIKDFDYNVGYIIKTNNTTNLPYVFVFMMNLKPREFGLQVPTNINENKRINQIVSEVINQYLKENLILN